MPPALELRSYLKRSRTTGEAGPWTGPWSVPDLCAAYSWPTSLAGGGVIAIVELGGGWTASDMAAYFESVRQPVPHIEDVSVDGTTNSPGGDADGEVALDIQVAAASYYAATGKVASIRVYWARDIAPAVRAATQDGCDVCSISWGADEAAWGPAAARDMEQAAAEATAAGMVVLAASGDNDSSDGGPTPANVDLPAACPHVIGCGGTSKTRASEVVWNDAPGSPSGDGTGGGYSTLFPMPMWQAMGGAPRGPGRMVPDVAAVADPRTGYEIYLAGSTQVVGGTSAVAPLYAGLLAAMGCKLGFISAKLWLSSGNFADVWRGNNGMYHALRGPDPCTGLGVPVGTRLGTLLGERGPSSGLSAPSDLVRLSDAIAWATLELPRHDLLGASAIEHLVDSGLRTHWPRGATPVRLLDAISWAESQLPSAAMTWHAANHHIAQGLTRHWPKGLP